MTDSERIKPPPEKTPLERMIELTRRVVAVPKSEVIKPKPKQKRAKRKPR